LKQTLGFLLLRENFYKKNLRNSKRFRTALNHSWIAAVKLAESWVPGKRAGKEN
jgi:hypothetical protein